MNQKERDYFFRFNSRDDMRRWAKALRHVRFVRAVGGHANDYDAFLASVRLDAPDALPGLASRLGITLRPATPGAPRPVPGHPYSCEELARFETAIRAIPAWQQPGRQDIGGAGVFVWVLADRVTLTVSSRDGYGMGERELAEAGVLDEKLAAVAELLIDPPSDSLWCLCPRYHRELFSSD